MGIKLELPKLIELKPRIIVVGVGGAGGNAINNMIASGLSGVDFMVANTDAQALASSSAEHRIQLGVNLTEGLGAGSRPEIGEAAAEEAIEDIKSRIANAHMVFLAAGMGGGTGTGAAAVMARIAKELGILTVAIVTKPFQFEGARRMRIAEAGIAELKKQVDTLIVIPNQNLFKIANEKTTFAEAFVLADQVLYSGVACIIDLIVKDGLINLDFADVRTVLKDMGTAVMGTGEGKGERRAILAAEEAITNRLLEDVSLRGAKGLLLSITGGRDLTLYEVDEAASRVRQEVDPDANIIVGATFDEQLGDRVRVSIVASGMERQELNRARDTTRPAESPPALPPPPPPPRADPQLPRSSAPFPPLAPPPPLEPASTMQRAPVPPQRATPRRAEEEENLKRRLADAFGPPPEASTRGDEEEPIDLGPPTGVAVAPASGEAPRQAWFGAGDVTIEDGPPRMGHAAPSPQPHSARGHEAPASSPVPPVEAAPQGQGGFQPMAPVEVRRTPPRIPGIDEFPAVGQAEYRAKTAGQSPYRVAEAPAAASAARASAPSSQQPERRKGLFERWTGGGRDPNATASPHEQAPSGKSRVELPMFFDRERK